jgi:hypothetical protein
VLNISKIRVKVWTTSGRIDVYVSAKDQYPRYGSSELQSVTLNKLHVLEYDISSLSDLTGFRLYIGLFGAQYAYFKL